MTTGTTTELDAAGFEAFINQDQPVLVDFWAPWCGPCRMLSPTIEKLAESYPGRVAKLNVDDAQEVAAKLGIGSIPTVIVFKNGQASEVMVGLRPEQSYVDAMGA